MGVLGVLGEPSPSAGSSAFEAVRPRDLLVIAEKRPRTIEEERDVRFLPAEARAAGARGEGRDGCICYA